MAAKTLIPARISPTIAENAGCIRQNNGCKMNMKITQEAIVATTKCSCVIAAPLSLILLYMRKAL